MTSAGSFKNDYILRPVGPQILKTVRHLGEFKGREALHTSQAPQALETLRERAVIQSVESSNRIEGVVAPIARLRQLVAEKTQPRDRPEQEIAGYREVLKTIHASARDIPFTPNVVLQFHRDLYQYLPVGYGGRWKGSDNTITETTKSARVRVRFRPVPAFETPASMKALHERFNRLTESGEVDPLLLIPAYVLDFLCIHPFSDGNGRMARLITLLLLYQAGYEVGRYISLEQIVERTKESYYEALEAASRGWHEGAHRIEGWWEYFLGVVLLSAYGEFEERVGSISSARGAKADLVRDVIGRLPKMFRYADVEQASPNVSRPTIQRVFAEMRTQGLIRCVKAGRDAVWQKV